MTPVDHDLDDILRRALHAAADSIEPADDALMRIRHRMREPWLARQASLVRNDCVDLVQLIAIRLEPAATRVRRGIANGPLGTSVAWIRGQVPAMALPGAAGSSSRRHDAAHRNRSSGGWAGVRPTLAWLRPALAVATAVVVVMAGVYGLAQLRETLRLSLFPSSGQSSAVPNSSTRGQPSLGHRASTSPGGLIPTAGGSGSPRHARRATCSRTSSTKPSSVPSPTSTSTPTASSSASPSPTDSLDPSSTPSAMAGTLTVNTIVIAGKAASLGSAGAAAAHCTRSTPKASAKPSPS
jgi:hypothetical protein